MRKGWLSALMIVLVATTWIVGVSPSVEAQKIVTVRMVWQGEANEMSLYERLIASKPIRTSRSNSRLSSRPQILSTSRKFR